MSEGTPIRAMTPDEEEMLVGMYPKAAQHHIKQLWVFSQSKGLNPITRQITMQVRRDNKANVDKAAFVTSIDALRLKAASTGQYAGSDDYEYDERDGERFPVKARSTVWRLAGGQRVAFTSTVRWSEFGSTDSMWARMPFHMLGKCAEAQALRKGFPEELSGLYIDEEMDQADTPVVREDAPKSAAALNERTQEALKESPKPEVHPRVVAALKYFASVGKDEAAVLSYLKRATVLDITPEDLNDRLTAWMEELKREDGNA